MGKMATGTALNAIVGGVFSSNLSKCRTKAEIIATNKFIISGTYADNQLVDIDHITKKPNNEIYFKINAVLPSGNVVVGFTKTDGNATLATPLTSIAIGFRGIAGSEFNSCIYECSSWSVTGNSTAGALQGKLVNNSGDAIQLTAIHLVGSIPDPNGDFDVICDGTYYNITVSPGIII